MGVSAVAYRGFVRVFAVAIEGVWGCLQWI